MIEVEVKVRADHDKVEIRLEETDAVLADEYEQRDTYFTAPHRDFTQTDEALRVRSEVGIGDETDDTGKTETTYVTYKGPKIGEEAKTREEYETMVGEGEEARSILTSLGFEEFGTVVKHRRVYRLDGTVVTLDSVDGLGDFVEVESDVEDESEVEEAHTELHNTLELLGLDPDGSIRESYLELLYG